MPGAALGLHVFDTALGPCGVAWGPRSLVGVQLPEGSREQTAARMRSRFPDAGEVDPPAFVQVAIRRIQSLLEGAHDNLVDIPLDMEGIPEFNRRVYAVARAIPPGRVMTYGDVARAIGEPGASRAVGQALGHNPFAPVVPCHRILAAGGRPGGFSADGGPNTKLRMLEIEKAQFGKEPGLFD